MKNAEGVGYCLENRANSFRVNKTLAHASPGLKQPWAGIGERRWRNNLAKKTRSCSFATQISCEERYTPTDLKVNRCNLRRFLLLRHHNKELKTYAPDT
jgi:hypothetical protein